MKYCVKCLNGVDEGDFSNYKYIGGQIMHINCAKPSELETLRAENKVLSERVKELEKNFLAESLKLLEVAPLRAELDRAIKQRNIIFAELTALKESKTIFVRFTP